MALKLVSSSDVKRDILLFKRKEKSEAYHAFALEAMSIKQVQYMRFQDSYSKAMQIACIDVVCFLWLEEQRFVHCRLH